MSTRILLGAVVVLAAACGVLGTLLLTGDDAMPDPVPPGPASVTERPAGEPKIKLLHADGLGREEALDHARRWFEECGSAEEADCTARFDTANESSSFIACESLVDATFDCSIPSVPATFGFQIAGAGTDSSAAGAMSAEDVEFALWGELEERFPPQDGYEVGVKCDDVETDRFLCEYWADEPGSGGGQRCNPATEICDENGEATTHDNANMDEVTVDQDGKLHFKYGLPIGPGGSE